MIKTLLLCTDGSPCAETACRYGLELARQLKARVTGLHVLDTRMLEGPLLANISGWIGAQPFGDPLPRFRELMQKKGEAVLEALNAMEKKEGVIIDSRLKWGHPAREILKEEAHTELVVMGRDGEHEAFTGSMTGSTVDRVVRHSTQPCLITPKEYRPIRRMLTAYDGSAHSGKALQTAVELALSLSIPLVVLTIVEEEDRNRAMQMSQDAMSVVRAHECAAAQMIVEGKVHETILEKAGELNTDLIVAGSHGHSRIRELILGSTASYLMDHTTIPLMLVR